MWLGRVAALVGATIVVVGATAVVDLSPPAPHHEPNPVRKTCGAASTGVVLPLAQRVEASGILGTSTADLQGFASEYNEIRIANCLATIPTANFRVNDCVEDRLIWIAEDPSDDPLSAWGHDGTERSDGRPPVGCDANLAGGPDTTGERAAQKWWFSDPHRESLYRPDYGGPSDNVCIDFAMVHGGIPDEPISFTRAGAVWGECEQYLDRVERAPNPTS